jgi:hypothetical protein
MLLCQEVFLGNCRLANGKETLCMLRHVFGHCTSCLDLAKCELQLKSELAHMFSSKKWKSFYEKLLRSAPS